MSPEPAAAPVFGNRAGAPIVIGHRGAPADLPEHTAASYRLAIAQGADAVEPDVVPTRDGVLLVRHEPVLDGTTDIARHAALAARARPAPVGGGAGGAACSSIDYAWRDLRDVHAVEPFPHLRPGSARHDGEWPLLRLRELVDLLDEEREAGRPCRLVLELKHPAAFAALGFDLVDLLERELDGRWSSPSLDGLVIESFDREALRHLRARGLPGRLVALIDDAGGPADAPGVTYADELTPRGLDALAAWADGISPSHRLLGVTDDASAADPAVGRALVEAAHERGLAVATWTLRPEDEFLPAAFAGRPEGYWSGVLRTGVDAVFADAPGRVRALIDAGGWR